MNPTKIKMRRWLGALVLGLALGLGVACAPPLKGIDLGKERAPDFRLSDARGNSIALADLRGKVVVLTFLYTNCVNECPLIASKFRNTANQLGDAMKQVAFIAVSTDPEGDTPLAVEKFLQEQLIQGQLAYLIGARAQLEPVWQAYYVATATNSSSVKSLLQSTRVIVIDKQGNQRVDLRGDFIPADLVFDIRALLSE